MTDRTAEMCEKLDVLIALTAISVLSGKSQREQIEGLSRAGLAPRDIGAIVGTSPNTVSVTLSKMKKSGQKSRKTG